MTNLPLLPDALECTLADVLGSPIIGAVPVPGGMINQAAQVATHDSPYFVKWNVHAPADFFQKEARGLSMLRATNTLRVPAVVGLGQAESTPFLVLEWLNEGTVFDSAEFSRRFAEKLAALHHEHASSNGKFGLGEDNYLGTLPQRNTWRENWAEFYRDCRLLPQIEVARARGYISPEREQLLLGVIENLSYWLGDFEPRAVLLHGDLWSGNYLTATGGAAVIDPAVYYGEREIEIAYIELFGGFPSGFIKNYDAIYPLDPSYQRRRALYQLYPLLVHLNLFGEPYGRDIERICRTYAHRKI
jgi:fructosamine-3-kinase